MGRRTFPPPHNKPLQAVPLVTGAQSSHREEWSFVIASSELLPQLRAVRRAHDAAVRIVLPVSTWERPA
ncbi:hypothetical protein HPB47_020916, partial [Ixodes persulcatus]